MHVNATTHKASERGKTRLGSCRKRQVWHAPRYSAVHQSTACVRLLYSVATFHPERNFGHICRRGSTLNLGVHRPSPAEPGCTGPSPTETGCSGPSPLRRGAQGPPPMSLGAHSPPTLSRRCTGPQILIRLPHF